MANCGAGYAGTGLGGTRLTKVVTWFWIGVVAASIAARKARVWFVFKGSIRDFFLDAPNNRRTTLRMFLRFCRLRRKKRRKTERGELLWHRGWLCKGSWPGGGPWAWACSQPESRQPLFLGLSWRRGWCQNKTLSYLPSSYPASPHQALSSSVHSSYKSPFV